MPGAGLHFRLLLSCWFGNGGVAALCCRAAFPEHCCSCDGICRSLVPSMVPRSGVAKLQRFRVLARERQRHSKVRVIAGNCNELSYIKNPYITPIRYSCSRHLQLDDVKDALAQLRGQPAADLSLAPVLEFGYWAALAKRLLRSSMVL